MKKEDIKGRWKFYKEHDSDEIYWVDCDQIGLLLFSFDKEKIFTVFGDYPEKLTPKQKEIFDKENPYFAYLLNDDFELPEDMKDMEPEIGEM